MIVHTPLIIPEILMSDINHIIQVNNPLRNRKQFFEILSPLLNYISVNPIFEGTFGIKWEDENQFEVNTEQLSNIIQIDEVSILNFLSENPNLNLNNRIIHCQFPTIRRPDIYSCKYIDRSKQIRLQHFEGQEQLFKEKVGYIWDFFLCDRNES